MGFNHDLAVRIVAKLYGFPNQCGEICADDFGITHPVFRTQLEEMKKAGLIVPTWGDTPENRLKTFESSITNCETRVEVLLTGLLWKKFLKNFSAED